jgi:hypothetical protein
MRAYEGRVRRRKSGTMARSTWPTLAAETHNVDMPFDASWSQTATSRTGLSLAPSANVASALPPAAVSA